MESSKQDHLSTTSPKHLEASEGKGSILERLFGSQFGEKPKEELVKIILQLIEDCRRLELENEDLRSKLSQDKYPEGRISQSPVSATDYQLDEAPKNVCIGFKQEDAIPGQVARAKYVDEAPRTSDVTEVCSRKQWRCDGCETVNDLNRLQCVTCDQRRYSSQPKSSESNELVQCKECGVVINRGNYCPICQSRTTSISYDPKCEQPTARELEEKDEIQSPLNTGNQERSIPRCETQQQAGEMARQVETGRSERGADISNLQQTVEQTGEDVGRRMETAAELEYLNSVKKLEEVQSKDQSECGKTRGPQQTLCRQCGVVTVLVCEDDETSMATFSNYLCTLEVRFSFGRGKTTAELIWNFAESLCKRCIDYMYDWIELNHKTADINNILDFIVVMNETGGRHCHLCMMQVASSNGVLCDDCSALELHMKTKVQSVTQSHQQVVSTASLQLEADSQNQQEPTSPSALKQNPLLDNQSWGKRELETTVAAGLPIGRGRGYLQTQKMDTPGLVSDLTKSDNQVVSVSSARGDAIHAPLSGWICTKCEHDNGRQDYICQKCFERRTDVAANSVQDQRRDIMGVWTCASCTLVNDWKDEICASCAKNRVFTQETSNDFVQDEENVWVCSVCTMKNKISQSFCFTCNGTRFGIVRFQDALLRWQWRCPCCRNENSVWYKYCWLCYSRCKHLVCALCGCVNLLTAVECVSCYCDLSSVTTENTSM